MYGMMELIVKAMINQERMMRTLEIELPDEVYQAISRLAQENATEPATLLRVQIERLAASYQGAGLTPGVRKHLAASIQAHRPLLQRLAQ
jgi:hypothetical protein